MYFLWRLARSVFSAEKALTRLGVVLLHVIELQRAVKTDGAIIGLHLGTKSLGSLRR